METSTPTDPGVVLVVRLHVDATRVPEYERFERDAARELARHGARIERVIRCADGTPADEPFEVHLVRFPDEAAVVAWRRSPDTRALATRREAVVRDSSVFRGRDHPGYHDGDASVVPIADLLVGDVPAVSARWAESTERLTTTYEFPGFGEAIRFMASCTAAIDALDHHPDWSNARRRVHVSLTTHSAGHVTDLDRRLAAVLDRLYAGDRATCEPSG